MIDKLDVRSGWQQLIFVSITYHKLFFILYLTFLAQTQSYPPFHCRLAFFYLCTIDCHQYATLIHIMNIAAPAVCIIGKLKMCQ